MPNLSKKKVIPIHAGWSFSLESKSLLRLHKHGLLRLFKMEAYNKSKPFHSTTFFSSLVESNLYQELFFDHFSQFVKGKHGPFLIKNIKADHFVKESNRFLHEGLNRIIMLLGLLIGMVFILVSIYGFLLIYKQEIPYLGWIGFVILVITFGAFFILFNHLPGKGWGKTETLGPNPTDPRGSNHS